MSEVVGRGSSVVAEKAQQAWSAFVFADSGSPLPRSPVGSSVSEVLAQEPSVLALHQVSIFYGSGDKEFCAVRDVTLDIPEKSITAIIGPSGCGKSSVLRSMNRMLDLTPSARVEGDVLYRGNNLYQKGVDPVEVRRRIGMVFQKPNPFPKSIYDNVAWGIGINRLAKTRNERDHRVEQALREAALWDEVKDTLNKSGLSLSGGQQQRLCIARALAVEPDVLLMDEPCASLDPGNTHKIEDLMQSLKANHTVLVVTHNLQQAARVSQHTIFMTTERAEGGDGMVIESGPTRNIFTVPQDRRTEAYVTGRFG